MRTPVLSVQPLRRMPSIGGYHPYRLASILNELESNIPAFGEKLISAADITVIDFFPHNSNERVKRHCSLPMKYALSLSKSGPTVDRDRFNA
ncbi:hypothetical protein TNCV_2581231 [Trichonephila clavipes]|nr:hypothetical protein TNCV_2581231 [Trichonephila clavipes]